MVNNSLEDRCLGMDAADKKKWPDVTKPSIQKCQVTLNDLCSQLKD